MRSLIVVAATIAGTINKFPLNTFTEARNLKDFLEQIGEYGSVDIYEQEKSLGPIKQWAKLEEIVQ